jgi:hypothetical protein
MKHNSIAFRLTNRAQKTSNILLGIMNKQHFIYILKISSNLKLHLFAIRETVLFAQIHAPTF